MTSEVSASRTEAAPSSFGDTAPRTDSPGEMQEFPGKLGRYHVLKLLGEGGMGVVLAAYDPDLDREVALKLLHRGGSDGAGDRLLREAHALARLSHPNVVQIYDTGLINGQVFIAMELVRGVDLRAWLAHPRSPAAVLRVFLDAGRGLAAAHDVGFVHRDFKPENVMVGDDDRVRVADFGLVCQNEEATLLVTAQPARGVLNRTLTRTGAQLGTPGYMSPEQHLGLATDARSDQFSFCVALWEALHGQRAFAGDDVAAFTEAVLSGQILPPPRSSRAPRYLTRVLARGMARSPEQRYPTMHILLAALARDPSRTRSRWFVAVTCGGLLTGAAVAQSSVAEPCSGGRDELSTVWAPARREAIARTLAHEHAPDLATLVLTGLDAYAEDWIASHRDACLDHRRGEQSSAVLDARMRCLARRRQTIDAAAQLLTADAEPGVLDAAAATPDAAQLVARLPPIAACDDPAVVLSEAALPEDPALAAEVTAIEALLSSARVRHDAGNVEHASVMAEEAATRARLAQFQPILAEALLVKAHILFTQNAYDGARPALSEALIQAVEGRRDDLAAEAIARILFVDGVAQGRTEEALRLAPLALAMASRAPEPHTALGRAHNIIGGVQLQARERQAASASMTRAVAEMLAVPRHDPIELANAMFNAAMLADTPAERSAGMARANELLAAHLGPRHVLTIDHRAGAAAFAPDLRAGVEQFAAICPEYLRLHGGAPITCKLCFYQLADLEMALGDVPRALASAEQVLMCPVDIHLSLHDEHLRDKARAFIAVYSERPLEALEILTRAQARIEPERQRKWMTSEFAQLDLLRGLALLQQGRPGEAAEALTRALLPFTASVEERAYLTARVWLARAQALLARALLAASPPDPDRAAQLTEAARTTFVALGASHPRVPSQGHTPDSR